MVMSEKDEFLLCYNGTGSTGCSKSGKWNDLTVFTEFGLYVDKHGGPTSRSVGTVEWEGTAERVAWHPPYVLLFDCRFIEIRHVGTGHLVQIISGNDLRCTWDGRGMSQSQVIFKGPWDELVLQEPRIHGVMNTESPKPAGRGVATQHVFELIPTVPLCLPGPSTSPPRPPHLDQSDSLSHPLNVSPHQPPSDGFNRTSMVAGGNVGPPPEATTSQSSTSIDLVDSDIPAWKRLISHALLPHEIVPLIETIIMNKHEVREVCGLRGDDAQIFINVIHEVYLHSFPPRHNLTAFVLFGPFTRELQTSTPSRLWIFLTSRRASGGSV